MENYACIDNELAAAQLAIGESSNIAQLCLTYTYNSDEQKYNDYVCILSCLAQIAIDNAKRKFNIDLTNEIKRIKDDLNDSQCKYPKFWIEVKKRNDKRYSKKRKKNGNPDYVKTDSDRLKELQSKNKFRTKFNTNLSCPMNEVINILKIEGKNTTATIPITDFIIYHKFDNSQKKNKQIEKLIEDYSLKVYHNNINYDNEPEKWLLLHSDFEDMIQDIKRLTTKSNLVGLMSWLINRAFNINPRTYMKSNYASRLDKNKSLLLKTLYTVNKDIFMSCFKPSH